MVFHVALMIYKLNTCEHQNVSPSHHLGWKFYINTKSYTLVVLLQAGMIEFVGLIKVNVVKGTNLAVRDVMTSDPYVLLALGQQVSLFSHCTELINFLIIITKLKMKGIVSIMKLTSHILLQSVKTRVIKNNLNPVWNERLMLSIPEQIPPLRVVRLPLISTCIKCIRVKLKHY